jgi:cobaltochelatase CobS
VSDWLPVTAPEDVPFGASWRWRWRDDKTWHTYVRCDAPDWARHRGLEANALWGFEIDADGNVATKPGYISLDRTGRKDLHIQYRPTKKDEEMIDILTASKGQLVEEAVKKFGPDARENALRTRLEQLREALQENEAPAWWSIGAGDNKVKPGQGGGNGKGQGQGQGKSDVVIAGRNKVGPVELQPQQVAEIVKPFLKIEQPKLDEAKVAKMVDAAVKHHVPAPVEVKIKDAETGEVRELGKTHRNVPQLIRYLKLNRNVMLVGPAGSFKTSSAEKAAEALGLEFYMTSVGMQTSKADLLGYQDAHGNTVRTHLRNAYENGGLFLLDEVDAGNANVLTVINALLANNVAAFPDKMVRRHKDFRFVAAGNTFGRGADRQYVGRNQLDAATLDRFVVLYWDYDEDFEMTVAGTDQSEWVRYVQKVRKAVEKAKVRYIVSPRASIDGATLLRDGVPRKEVEEVRLWGGMTEDDRRKVQANLAA